jgi:hypothetical protein
VLPGATAIITNLATKQSREAVTNDAGVYTFVFVPPGDYSVNIDLAGFKRFVRDNVRVNLGSAVVIDALLELGRLEETITVAGDSPQLQLTTSSLGTVVESEIAQRCSAIEPELHAEPIALGWRQFARGRRGCVRPQQRQHLCERCATVGQRRRAERTQRRQRHVPGIRRH